MWHHMITIKQILEFQILEKGKKDTYHPNPWPHLNSFSFLSPSVRGITRKSGKYSHHCICRLWHIPLNSTHVHKASHPVVLLTLTTHLLFHLSFPKHFLFTSPTLFFLPVELIKNSKRQHTDISNHKLLKTILIQDHKATQF